LVPSPALLTSRSSPRAQRSSTRPPHPSVVGEVDRQHVDLHAVRPQLLRLALQPRLVARDEHQVVAEAGELARERRTEAGGRAGDEGSGHGASCRVRNRRPAPGVEAA
jgi:hypothetical protein